LIDVRVQVAYALTMLALLLCLIMACAACASESQPVEPPAPLYAHATGRFEPIRSTDLVDPNSADATALDLATATWPVEGTASFRTTPAGVDLEIKLTQCRKPYAYPVSIHAGSDCTQITRTESAWDGARGELDTKAFCFGSPGALYAARASQSTAPWSLGGPAASNLIGRSLVIHDPDTNDPLVCAKIEVADQGALVQPIAADTRPRSTVVAQLAGLCVLGPTAFEQTNGAAHCPNLDNVADCALTHCVGACLEACAGYVACLSDAKSVCGTDCQPTTECSACVGVSTSCMLGFCKLSLACAPPPTPGGPCTSLRACCARQGPLTESCNRYADLMEQLSGDPSCLGALDDWDVNAHFNYRSPCYTNGPPEGL
jgi:hypothetical protein